MKISKSKLKQLIAEELTEAFGGHAARVRHDPASHSHADAVKSRGRPDPAAEREREREKKFRKQHQSQKADMMKQNPWLELEEGNGNTVEVPMDLLNKLFDAAITYDMLDGIRDRHDLPKVASAMFVAISRIREAVSQGGSLKEDVGDDELWEDDKYSAGYVDPAVEFAEQNHGRRVYIKGEEDKYGVGVVVGADECGFEETCVEVEMPGRGVILVDVSRLQLIGGPRGMGEQKIYEMVYDALMEEIKHKK